jgi:hypothetical protein
MEWRSLQTSNELHHRLPPSTPVPLPSAAALLVTALACARRRWKTSRAQSNWTRTTPSSATTAASASGACRHAVNVVYVWFVQRVAYPPCPPPPLPRSNMGAYDEAIADYTRAIELDSRFV